MQRRPDRRTVYGPIKPLPWRRRRPYLSDGKGEQQQQQLAACPMHQNNLRRRSIGVTFHATPPSNFDVRCSTNRCSSVRYRRTSQFRARPAIFLSSFCPLLDTRYASARARRSGETMAGRSGEIAECLINAGPQPSGGGNDETEEEARCYDEKAHDDDSRRTSLVITS